MSEALVLADDPRPHVRRITLNRPEKRNAMSNRVRVQLFDELRRGDGDNDVSVMVIRGAGSCFTAGYDLNPDPDQPLPRPIAIRDGFWSRSLVEGWFELMDMATPIIAQVHGYCLAGGSELAAACDLLYVAEDTTIGYPPVRTMSPPDLMWQPWFMGMRRAMEALLTGDSMTGLEAVEAGFADRATRPTGSRPRCSTSPSASRDPRRPPDPEQAHGAPRDGGTRNANRTRATTELQALGLHQRSSREYMPKLRSEGVKGALYGARR